MIENEKYINEAKIALENGFPEDALKILDQLENAGHHEAVFLKGEVYFKLQQWGIALNKFSHYKELEPDDQRSDSYCLMINNILGFYHRDLYNP